MASDNRSAAGALRLERVTKRFGGLAALEEFDLEVGRGDFVTLLGPSGSGKTTALMAVAGFVVPTSGRITLDGADITALPPERRGFGIVFQGYALFPHMTVRDNVAFPLATRRIGAAEIADRVRRVLDLVQLSGLDDRKPAQLSGGQQQRVAIARALIYEPRLVLLDEPLSALDRKLRADLQAELKALHRRTGLTFLHVTHDQEEALSLSTRVAVLSGGRLAQVGTPDAIYDRPATRFVAEFVGGTNIIEGPVVERGEREIVLGLGARRIRHRLGPDESVAAGAVLLSLRPESLLVGPAADDADNAADGVVTETDYAGSLMRLAVDVPEVGCLRTLSTAADAAGAFRIGDRLRVGWNADRTRIVAA
jgi:putative spermidine/putrescine transport system ATP-binding protein